MASSNSGTFSIRSETKDKFDALIKRAFLNENKTISKENLVEEMELRDINGFSSKDLEEEASKKVILEKFLSGSSSTNIDDNIVVIKPPVPKPRRNKHTEKLKKGSVSSTKTYNVQSPVILPKQQPDNDEISKSSNATYCVKKTKKVNVEVGHLLLHDSPTKIVIHSTNEIIEKNDTESLYDNKTYSESSDTLQNISTIPKTKEQVSVINSDSIETINEVKPKPTKRKNKIKRSTELSKNYDAKNEEKDNNNTSKILEIIIHRTDVIDLNAFIIHPVVKVHLVDINTGEYYKKADKNRPVVFYYENDNDYILPVMTTYYNLQENRIFYPMWEEPIIFNEDYNYLITENIIIFFEILDFLPAHADINNPSTHKSSHNGWINIAFAFLKPIGKNNALNTNKKLRLQLYYPGKPMQSQDSKKCHVWTWWHKKKYKKYPSTLYVTIKDIISPKKVIETFRSKTPLQKEEISNVDSIKGDASSRDFDMDKISIKRWPTIKNKHFQLPEKCLNELPSFGDGCFVLKFSWNGLYLAAALKIEDIFVTVVYAVEKQFEEVTKFSSHQKLVYSIVWSKDDRSLITASADNTVAVWNLQRESISQILPHPSYVYTTDITSDNLIATGCYDKIIRIWIKSSEYELSQELKNHTGYITSLCFNKHSTILYSADSVGSIIEWKRQDDDFILNRNIDITDIKGCVINEIILFPNEKKMLVHCRNSLLRIISVPNSCVLLWLHGAQNTRIQTFCSISPCGQYVTSGNENAIVIIWNAKTGKDVKIYNPKLPAPIHCVQFHTKINFIAMSHYGRNVSILVYGSEKNEDNNEESSDSRGPRQRKFGSAPTIDGEASCRGEKLQLREILQKMDAMLR